MQRNSKWISGVHFPSENNRGAWDNVPIAANFTAVEYSNKQSIRSNAPGTGTSEILGDFWLPMPRDVNTSNNITYSKGQSETTGGLFDMTTGGWGEFFKSGAGLFSAFNDLTGISALQGKRPMDERDSIFQGAEFRRHKYTWVLIPRKLSEAKSIASIAKGFQTLAYPAASDMETYSRVIHPPIWHINFHLLSDKNKGRHWSNSPLPCVLSKVDIQTAGAAAGGVYAMDNGLPSATKISVEFIELEPAINVGDSLRSRSQLRAGTGEGGESEEDSYLEDHGLIPGLYDPVDLANDVWDAGAWTVDQLSWWFE